MASRQAADPCHLQRLENVRKPQLQTSKTPNRDLNQASDPVVPATIYSVQRPHANTIACTQARRWHKHARRWHNDLACDPTSSSPTSSSPAIWLQASSSPAIWSLQASSSPAIWSLQASSSPSTWLLSKSSSPFIWSLQARSPSWAATSAPSGAPCSPSASVFCAHHQKERSAQ